MPTAFNKKLLSLAVCGVVASATQPLMAQEQEGTAMLEEIVVRGMRVSIENAQDIKRNASTVMDVVTASDIGALPDKSVTEALQRVPGVTIERFAASDDPNHYADEGTGVLVRGLDRVRSEINGRDSFSANPSGGLNFEDIPPELLGSVRVIKNQTADMIAGGIAGTVNLVTRKPFDSEGQVFGATVKANYGDFREEWTPSGSALYSNHWQTDAGEFGFLISGSHSEYKTRGDGVGVANYYSRGDAFEGIYDQWGGLIGTADSSPLEGPAVYGQEPGSVVFVPGQFSIRSAENDRERTGVATSFQWRNNEGTVATTLEYIKSDASLEYRERVIGTQGQGFDAATKNTVTIVDEPGYQPTFDDAGFFTSGVLAAGANLPMSASSRFNETSNEVEDLSFNIELTPTDRLTVDLDFQRIEATQSVQNYGVNARHQPPTSNAYLDLRGEYPTVEFLNSRFFEPETTPNWDGDRDDLFLATALDQNVDSDATSDAFKLDVEYQLDNGWARSVKAGAYYSEKELTIRDTEYSNWGALNEGWMTTSINAGGYANNPDEFERVDFGNFFGGGVLDGRGDFLFPKMSNAENFVEFTRRGCDDFLVAAYGGNVASEDAQNNPDCYLAQPDLGGRVAEGSPYAPHHISSSTEERSEAYVRFDFGFDNVALPIDGNVGLRYVNYQLSSTGYTIMPAAVGGNGAELFAEEYPNLAALADGSGQLQTVDGTDYDTVLPSLNLAFHLTDEVVMRFGASKGLYFPTLDQTRNSRVVFLTKNDVLEDNTQPASEDNPVVGFNNVALNGVARNPFLEPEESTNLDLTAEWYFSESGSLTLSLFHKEIENLFRERSFRAPVTNENNGATEVVSFTGPANEGSGSIQGFEVSYSQFFDQLPGAWSGLGVQLNYTYIDQEDLNDPAGDDQKGEVRFDSAGNPISDERNSFRAFTGLPLPGYSDENYNIVGMYEYEAIAARIAYTWRSDYLVTRRDSNEFAPIYSQDAGYMDASIYYTINDNVKIGLEGSNLLDTITTTEAQFNQEGFRTEALNFKTDRRYALSLRMNF